MNETNTTVCCECGEQAIFRHNDNGWCSSVTFMGMFNQFGWCANNKVDSPELKAYELNYKGEK